MENIEYLLWFWIICLVIVNIETVKGKIIHKYFVQPLFNVLGDQEWYEPVWSGERCRESDSVDVGRGSGSCNTDCDCPLCSPFCSRAGYCQNHQRSGRRKIEADKCNKAGGGSCPPPLGSPASPGCNLTFFEDVNGVITCNASADCPQGYDWWKEGVDGDNQCGNFDNPTFGRCQDHKCKFLSSNCGWFAPCFTSEDNLIIRGGYECRVNEDCYIDAFTKIFNQQLNMKCKTKKCISRNKTLWNSIPFTPNGNSANSCNYGYRSMEGISAYNDYEFGIYK